jgi:hypothetical protein
MHGRRCIRRYPFYLPQGEKGEAMKADLSTMAADLLQELEEKDAKELQKGVSVRLTAYLDATQVEKLQACLNDQGYHQYKVRHMVGERRVIVTVTQW